MIKLFRHARGQLLSQGKTRRYLKYAIGEIILVMIGILLALQVSNWNQNRLDRISEQKLLSSIHKDFLRNKKQFDMTKAVHQTHQLALEKIKSLLPVNGNSMIADSVDYYSGLIKSNTFNAFSSTVEAIVNTNAIEVIQNDTLKAYLISWKNALNDYKEEEDFYYKFLNETYYPFVIRSFDLIEKKPLERYSSKEYQNFVVMRLSFVNGILEAIKEEPLEFIMNEIIRLSNTEN